MINVDQVVALVERSLPTAKPFAAIPVLQEQIEFLDAAQGADLVSRLIKSSHPSNLVIPEEYLSKWPSAVAQRVLDSVRNLPSGKHRIRALCHLHRHLTLKEKREVLDGILDETFPATDFEFGKPINHDEVIEEFVKTLPNVWQDELLNQEVGIEQVMVRVKLDRLDEGFLRRAWSEIDHDVSDGEVPDDYFGLAEYLPMDLKSKALEVIRSAKDHSDRLHYLQNFDEELTEAERIEIVTIPWHGVGGESGDSGTLAQHLEFIEKHIPKIPYRYCVEWLEKVLDFEEDYDLQRGLVVLLDCLKNDDRKRAICALVNSVLRVDTFYTIKEFWHFVPDGEFEGILLRTKTDVYGWNRVGIVSHLMTERSPKLADRALSSLVGELDSLSPDNCLEVIHALTPWLTDRTNGEFSRRIAKLQIPDWLEVGDPFYAYRRPDDDESEL